MSDSADLKPLFEELRTYLIRYNGRNLLPGVDEILARLGDGELKEASTIYRTYIQSKNQLADFYVDRSETPDATQINARIEHIETAASRGLLGTANR